MANALFFIGLLLNNIHLVCSEPLGVQLEYAGALVIFCSISTAVPCAWHFTTQPMLNTSSSSMGSSGYTLRDRLADISKNVVAGRSM